MSIADRTNPYERFMDRGDREQLVASLQRKYRNVSSDEFEDAYSHMLEQLASLPESDVAAIDVPYTWLYVGMQNRLRDRVKAKSAGDVHFGDLPDAEDDSGSFLSDHDDSVVGSLVGRETAAEKLAEVAELVWQKFDGADVQLAARILLEHERPQALAAELGLDPKHVIAVAHQANQAHRLLEKKLKEDPEFRCWRLRKAQNTYYQTGEVSLALRAHWMTCGKCKSASRTAEEHTRRVLMPFLPAAAAPAGLFGLLRHGAHHALHPVRSIRRLVRPAAQLGGKTAAGSTQVSSVAGAISTKAAVVAVAAVVTAGGAGAVVVHHITAHHQPRVAAQRTAKAKPAVLTPPAVTTSTPTQTATTPVVHHTVRHKPKPKPKPKPKVKHKRRRAHRVAHTATTTTPVTSTVSTPVVTTPPVTTVATTPPATTTTASAPHTATTTAPVKKASSSTSGGQVTNPSYQTPSAP